MLLPRDVKIVNKLALLCNDNPVPLRCRHVAALADKNKIISLGMNAAVSDPGFFALSGNPRKQFPHAEWVALRGMGQQLKRLTLYVVRVDNNGQLAQSKPCPICEGALRDAQIRRVVHSVSNGIKELNYH